MKKYYYLLVFCFAITGLNAQGLAKDSLVTPSFVIDLFADGTRENLRDATSGKPLLYSGELWIGGYDQNQQLHQSAQTYKQGKVNYFPGPIRIVDDSLTYNRLWHVHRHQIDSAVLGLYTSPPQIFLDWPAHGDTANGEPFYLAPFVDLNNNGWYDPHYGDYPSIKGEEAVYFIYNDYGDGTQNLTALEVDIHGMAYRVKGGTLQDSILFIDYRIVNRSANDYTDTYIGSWADMDLGNSADDLVGTSIGHNALIGYNASANDLGALGFGHEVASLAQFIRKGPAADYQNGVDDNRDGCVDGILINGNCVTEDTSNGLREHHVMSISNVYFNRISGNTPVYMTDPQSPLEEYKLISGYCKNGLPLSLNSGTGIWDPGNPFGHCDSTGNGSFVYPGSSFDTSGAVLPGHNLNWFMPPGYSGDIRTIVSSGPFSLKSGEATSFNIAFMWHRTDSTTSALDGGYGQMLRKLDRIDSIVRAVDTATGGPGNVMKLVKAPSYAAGLELYHDKQNGTYELLNLSADKQHLRLYNISGQLLQTYELRGHQNLILNLNNYPAGIYLLGSSSNGQSFKLLQ